MSRPATVFEKALCRPDFSIAVAANFTWNHTESQVRLFTVFFCLLQFTHIFVQDVPSPINRGLVCDFFLLTLNLTFDVQFYSSP